MDYFYNLPRNPIPRYFLVKRHVYVRSILKNSLVLDLGCNKYKIIRNAVSLDISKEVEPNIVGNALNLPLQNCSFDSVTALELIEHFNGSDQSLFLNEAYRVLKSHGQLIVSTPNISESTRKIHDFLYYVSHSVYANKDLHVHIGELTHDQLKRKLKDHDFKIVSEKAFSIFNYVVECEKK